MIKTRGWLLVLAVVAAQAASAQVLTEWVETNPANHPNKIALGYPVPIPVNTPMPFDGFRTYAGLHARHQDLATTTPWVHAENIGTTRQGRTIWAYRLGDADLETVYGLPEPAMLTNGGIHAREWQTPEVVTGVLELIATHEDGHPFYDYLRDNANMIVIPVLNIDGFLQTQRYPATNYLESDIQFPSYSPRDGRMRRKNMLGVDEVLNTTADHLLGVDLNRNTTPFWNTNPDRSSSDNRSLVYHGSNSHSEPETEALDVAAALGPAGQLRVYTDVHSYSQVLFWVRGDNQRQTTITEQLLGFFRNHHREFPAGKDYLFNSWSLIALNAGIGATDEYFYHHYQVPSWTLEMEPSGSQGTLVHEGLPGNGADYGGLAENGHDGFILPDSEARRVREDMAQTFAAIYYRQAGPPSIQAMRFVDDATGAVVFEAEWDVADEFNRTLYSKQIQPLQLGRNYTQWIAYTKPMRWRENGEVVPFQGLTDGYLSVLGRTRVGGQTLTTAITGTTWQDQPGGAPTGYMDYPDDAVALNISYPLDATNTAAFDGTVSATIHNTAWDITGVLLDADPSTVAYWANGNWNNLENTQGGDSDYGGEDATISLQITDEELPAPYVLDPGTAAAWGDPQRVGEGFILEMLADGLAVMFWFTNDDEGGQDWYIGVGEVRGNRIIFPRVLRVSGGVFGDAFDPEQVSEEVVGSARFIWEGCDSGSMDWRIGTRRGRQNLVRLTTILGLPCGPQPVVGPIPQPPPPEYLAWSGSWGDPAHNGEGFTVEMLNDSEALVFWFSFGPDGKRRWYFGIGELLDGKLVFDNMLTTTGGVFGKDFDPDEVTETHWGTLELALDCAGGTATYVPAEAGFQAGQQNLQKITNLDGPGC